MSEKGKIVYWDMTDKDNGIIMIRVENIPEEDMIEIKDMIFKEIDLRDLKKQNE